MARTVGYHELIHLICLFDVSFYNTTFSVKCSFTVKHCVISKKLERNAYQTLKTEGRNQGNSTNMLVCPFYMKCCSPPILSITGTRPRATTLRYPVHKIIDTLCMMSARLNQSQSMHREKSVFTKIVCAKEHSNINCLI